MKKLLGSGIAVIAVMGGAYAFDLVPFSANAQEAAGQGEVDTASAVAAAGWRSVALNSLDQDIAFVFLVLSDPFCNGPSEAEHMVENTDAHHRLGLLGRQVAGSQAGTDNPIETGHRRFDQGASIVAR